MSNPKISLTFSDLSPALAAALLSVANGGAIAQVQSISDTSDDDDNAPLPAGATIPELDSNGLPWDARIHSANKATVKDGSWRKAKGVDAAVVTAVEAELRAALAAQIAAAPQPAVPAAPAPAVVPTEGVAPVAAPGALPVIPAMPASPEPAPMPVAATTPEPVQQVQAAPAAPDFQNLMGMIQRGMQTPGPQGTPLITPDYLATMIAEVNGAWAAHGVNLNGIAAVSQFPQVIPYVVQLLQRDGKAV